MRCWLICPLLAGCLPDSLPGDGDGDGYTYAIDCDDSDPNVGPAAEGEECERPSGDDSGGSLDTSDLDYDGFSQAEGDCDDTDPNISPTASDIVGDGIDQNCDEVDGTDTDGDGYASDVSGGDDCDDTNDTIHSGATEIAWNDIDEDCSGRDLHDYVQISAGRYYACGVASTGNIVCWGNPYTDYGQTDTIEGDFRQVVTGNDANCTISQNNQLECYGYIPISNDYSNPPGGPDFLAVSMPPTTSVPTCAINAHGIIVCGHCSLSGLSPCESPTGNYTQVDSAGTASCALTTEGAITCWGSGGASSYLQANRPVESGFEALAVANSYNACALDGSGALHCWGDGWSEPTGPESTVGSSGTFTHISAFSNGLCAVKDNGELWCHGVYPGNIPTGQFTQVTLSDEFGCALDTLGEAQCFITQTGGSQAITYGVLDPP